LRPIVTLGWDAERWGGRNLALRLVARGYSRVHWHRGGKEVWESRSLPETEAKPVSW
jgi:anti-sigma factor RsiW